MQLDTPLDVRLTDALDDGRPIWELLTSVIYDDQVHQIVVPRGSKSDGASIPAPFSWFIPTISYKTFLACIVHDHLITGYRVAKASGMKYIYTRKQIDKIFYEALLMRRTNRVLAAVMYLGVRFNAWQRQEK